MELTLYRAIEANRRRSRLLAALTTVPLTALFGASVWIIGYDASRVMSPLVVGLGAILFGSRDLVLLVLGAKPLDIGDAPRLHRRLDVLCVGLGLKQAPRVFVMDGTAANALALERVGQTGTLVVTRRLLDLGSDELDAVLAHELSHLVSAFVGLRSLVALLTALAAAVASTRSTAYKAAALLIGALALWLLGPAVVYLAVLVAIFLAAEARISREREHVADALAVLLTRHPDALVRALRAIDGQYRASTKGRRRSPAGRDAELVARSLWMAAPPRPARGRLARLFDALPETRARIRQLERIS